MSCPWPQKQRFPDDGAAWAASRSLHRSGKSNEDVRPYLCGDHWHIGHSVVALSMRIRRSLRRDR